MKKILCAVLLSLFVVVPAFATDEPPSDDSLRELLEVTQSHKLFDSAMQQMDVMMQAQMQKNLTGLKLSEAQKQAVDDWRHGYVALVQKEFNFEQLEPQVLDIYRKNFNQQEVDAMIRFYRSDAGQSMINKMPLVMQDSLRLAQSRMTELMPQLQAMSQDLVAKLAATQPAPGEGTKADSKKAGDKKSKSKM